MTTTQANRTTEAFGVEPSANTEPTGSTFLWSPNSIPKFDPEPERIARDPLGPQNMEEAGTNIRTPTRVSLDGDLNRDNFLAFIDGALRSTWGTSPRRFYPTSVRSTDYVVAANGALAQYTLVYARGFATAGNNGLKVVGAGSDGTHIVASGLTAEALSSGQGPTVEVCGYQGESGDLQIDASGDLISTTLDFTTLGLTAGQYLWIGGESSGLAFATAAHKGRAQAVTIAAHKITLGNKDSGKFPAAAADDGTGKTVQLFFGRAIRAVATTDSSYAERTYMLELAHGTLNAGSAMHEYATGCGVTSWRAALPPVGSKATLAIDLEAQAYVEPTGSRRSSFSAPLRQNASALVKTGSGIQRGRIRQSTTALTGYISSVDLTIASGLNRIEAHGSDAAVMYTFGDIQVTGSAQVHFSESALMSALLSDTVCNADWWVRSTDGWAVVFDIPALQLQSAPRSYAANMPTMAQVAFKAVRDTTYSTVLMLSDFPYVPAS